MRQASHILTVETDGTGLVDITGPVFRWAKAQAMREGLLTLFCRHTSASLLISENADPAVGRDLLRWLEDVGPEGRRWEHDDEGPDDMPAHLRAVLTGVSLSIPLIEGVPALGTWQGIFLAEHRRRPHRRTVAMHLIGD